MEPSLLAWAETQGIGAVIAILLIGVLYKGLQRVDASVTRLIESVDKLNASVELLLDRATRVAEKTVDLAQIAQHTQAHLQHTVED